MVVLMGIEIVRPKRHCMSVFLENLRVKQQTSSLKSRALGDTFSPY